MRGVLLLLGLSLAACATERPYDPKDWSCLLQPTCTLEEQRVQYRRGVVPGPPPYQPAEVPAYILMTPPTPRYIQPYPGAPFFQVP